MNRHHLKYKNIRNIYIPYVFMTILEVNLGQVNTYDIVLNSTYTSNVKSVGLIINNQSKLDTPITLQNRPQNNFFNVRKPGNTNEYVLILSFKTTKV